MPVKLKGTLRTQDNANAPALERYLRSFNAHVVRTLEARGATEVSRVYHLDRGYQALEKKLRSLGARIQRIR